MGVLLRSGGLAIAVPLEQRGDNVLAQLDTAAGAGGLAASEAVEGGAATEEVFVLVLCRGEDDGDVVGLAPTQVG